MKEQKLTIKQDKFIKEYIKTGNGKQSAIKAGYSKKTAGEMAYENLNKPQIKVKIEKTMSETAEKMGINAEFVLGNLKHFASKKKMKAANAALKANELLGKHLKLFHDTERDLIVEHKMNQKLIEDLG